MQPQILVQQATKVEDLTDPSTCNKIPSLPH